MLGNELGRCSGAPQSRRSGTGRYSSASYAAGVLWFPAQSVWTVPLPHGSDCWIALIAEANATISGFSYFIKITSFRYLNLLSPLNRWKGKERKQASVRLPRRLGTMDVGRSHLFLRRSHRNPNLLLKIHFGRSERAPGTGMP
jgi:hypothetical protein